MTVLVGYATRHGSTRDIAERIAVRLTDQGLPAYAYALDSLRGARGYDAFVLGSAIHDTAWLPEAVAFARRHPSTLTACPVWLFSTGLPMRTVGRWWQTGAREPKEIAEFAMLIHPLEHQLFAGVFQRDHTSLFGHLLFRAAGGEYGDHRDWVQIDGWADRIARRLRAGTPLTR
ncbi:flavodoxin domain-containing protein [Streptomyces sp. S.PB5]|uniref:flavodoxin domain-containing protein n=1 Tax=Streptomyces sp. S.PB5 TaxID=3020844 RepID=UPI0025B25D14|nr:flavodoxin domain-containing protein [Streptomyces sp. S.PB5]MDN3028454.1 flavodoxin domain-containing protein [Streptomyces sp. S.PB5]